MRRMYSTPPDSNPTIAATLRGISWRWPAFLALLSLLLWTGCSLAEKSSPAEIRGQTAGKPALAAQVRGEMQRTWAAYTQYAWGYDELNPISKTPRNWYAHSLLMTPVDALDTLIIMGLDKEARAARELIATNLNLDQDMYVKGFEINIRLLGGLLSGYQLTGDPRLLRKANELADRLLPLFETPTGMPYVEVNLKTHAVRNASSNPAEVGTYLLEFGTLSKLTGNPIYYDKAKRAVVALYERRSAIGLVGTAINIETGEWTSSDSHLSGCIDSYYEYLFKCYKLLGDQDCLQMWQTHLAAINQYLGETVSTGFWYGHANMNTGERTEPNYGALDAYFPAMLVLAGDLDRAIRLEDSCYKMWNLHGIEPEQINYRTLGVLSPGYVLRPEVIESAYYLYFATGNPRYLEMGETFWSGLLKDCKTEAGFAALKSVVTKEKEDNMESFFLAETMKYLYLIFAPRHTLDLNTVVLNTECHPLRNTWSR